MNEKKLKKEEAQELLKKYRLGLCTERELAVIERWYKSYDTTEVSLPNDLQLKAIKAEMLQNIKNTIDRNEIKVQRGREIQSTAKVRVLNFTFLKRIAAVLALGGVIGLFVYNQQQVAVAVKQEVPQQASQPQNLPSLIFLSDGSKVKLKEGSKLLYPQSFSGNIREVTLIGEAFFDIAKDKDRPFIIHAGRLTTRVLGTSFNIKAYEEAESSEVSVITGKVVVSVAGDSDADIEEMILVPNQRAVYSKKQKALRHAALQDQVPAESEKKARLVFNETSLEEIIKVLNAYYDVNITLENNKMKRCLITAELTDEPIEVSLTIISKAIGAEYEIKETGIVLSGKSCGLEE